MIVGWRNDKGASEVWKRRVFFYPAPCNNPCLSHTSTHPSPYPFIMPNYDRHHGSSSSTRHHHGGGGGRGGHHHDSSSSSSSNVWAIVIGIIIFIMVFGLIFWAFSGNGYSKKVVRRCSSNDDGEGMNASAAEGVVSAAANYSDSDINAEVDAFYRNMQAEADITAGINDQVDAFYQSLENHQVADDGMDAAYGGSDFDDVAAGINDQVDRFYHQMKSSSGGGCQ